jgi:hypothetical protein
MLILSAILSVVLVASVFSAFKRGDTPWVGFWLPVGGAVCLAIPPLILHAVLVIPAHFLWKWRRWPASSLLAYMLLVGVASYGLVAFFAGHRLAELRSEYPVESMEKRVPEPKNRATNKWSNVTEMHLNELETYVGREQGILRKSMLQQLHEDSMQTFINSPEFGVSRGVFPSKETIKLSSEHDESPLAQPGPFPPAIYPEDDIRLAKGLNTEPLVDLHLGSVANFINPRGFGWIVSRQKVAGFQSHQFRSIPQSKEWKIQTLDLVGLLMHDAPVVYISDELPRMEKLRKVPTRGLDRFEAAGIDRLQEGDELFIRETPETLRMLGAVRSIEQCVKCHGGQRGDLLGAFSYRLQRVQ